MIRSPSRLQLSGRAIPLLIFTRLKECDVTWLYGPLQTSSDSSLRIPCFSPVNGGRISKFDSSLLKQAAAGVQAQRCHKAGRRRDQTGAGRAICDPRYISFLLEKNEWGKPWFARLRLILRIDVSISSHFGHMRIGIREIRVAQQWDRYPVGWTYRAMSIY